MGTSLFKMSNCCPAIASFLGFKFIRYRIISLNLPVFYLMEREETAAQTTADFRQKLAPSLTA